MSYDTGRSKFVDQNEGRIVLLDFDSSNELGSEYWVRFGRANHFVSSITIPFGTGDPNASLGETVSLPSVLSGEFYFYDEEENPITLEEWHMGLVESN